LKLLAKIVKIEKNRSTVLLDLDVDEGKVAVLRFRVKALVVLDHLLSGKGDNDNHVADDCPAQNQGLPQQFNARPAPEMKTIGKKV
jgi:hypothetical protein